MNFNEFLNEKNLNEAFEVHYSDGVRASKKFNNQKQAIDFAKDLIKNKKSLQFVDVFNAGSGFHSTADTDAIVAFWGDGSYTDNVAKKDPKLAAKKIEESVEEVSEGSIKVGDIVSRKFVGEDPTQTWKVISISGGKAKLEDTKTGEENGMYLSDLVKESVEEVLEGKYSKDQLLKLISKLDDAEIIVKGKQYIIYNPDSNNDDNAAMWGKDTIKALNSDGDEFEFKYSDIQQFNESEEVSEASKFGAPAGLTKAQTKKVAETLAKAMSKAEGAKVTVNLKTLAEDSFDLDYDGEEYDGGSYNIYDDGSVVNHAVTPNEIYGKSHSSVEDFIKGLKKPIKESLELNEAAVKQFEKDFADMVKNIKQGFGWIDPEYVEETWENSSDSIDFDLVKAEIYKRLIKAGLLWHTDENDGEEKGKQVKSLKELGIKESVEINESKITLKRQYTNNYPARTVGKHAAIRNKIIEALKDGELTKEDFDQLVSGLTEDSKRWLRRNAEFFNIGEDKVALSKNGQRILKSITHVSESIKNNNITMENKFIYESFVEFVEFKLNESNEFVAEALTSSILSGFIDLRFAPKDLFKAFYNYTKVALDKIEDADFIEMSPSAAYKSKDLGSAIVFYVSRNEKANPHAPADAYYSNKTIPANSLLAIANGQNEFFGVSWMGRYSTSKGYTLKNVGKDGNVVDTAGIGKKYRSWDATGLSNVKRISEVSDVAYVLPLEVVRQKYSTEGIRAARAAAQAGATALKDAKSFKEENIARYKSILATRIMNDDLDGKVEKAILKCSDLISKAVQGKQFTKYGEMKLGNAPDGREVTLRDATNFMNNLISDYTEYARYKNEGEQEGGGYYEKQAKQKAIYIKERIAKLDNLNIAW
jgi:hypothetical protein